MHTGTMSTVEYNKNTGGTALCRQANVSNDIFFSNSRNKTSSSRLTQLAASNDPDIVTENDEQLYFTHAQEYKGKALYDSL